LRLAAAWFGHPQPTMVWTLNDKTVKPDGKNVIESSEPLPPPTHPGPGGPLEQSPGATEVLTVPKARRADTGEYKLTLMNDQGQTSTTCKVEVIDVPAAPSGPLEATDVKADEITLHWKAPEDDGGEPITNYVLEKKPKNSDNWEKVSGFLHGTTATVRNLEEGKEYDFRVMAENAMGVSEPLTTDHAIKAKHPFDPPSGMDKPTVEDTTDDSVTIAWNPPRKGPVTGYVVEKRPKGDKNWTKKSTGQGGNDKEWHAFKVEVTPNEVIVTDTKAEKEDSGPLQITLKNEKGEATAPVTLKVQGPPEPPKGPLEVTDVRGDSCKLSWNPPADNGGSPVTNYIVEKMDTKTGEWTPVSRFVRQPEYEVTGLEEGNNYKFRVRAENELGVSEPLEAERSIKAENPATAPDSPSNVNVVDVDSDKVKLEWSKPRNDGGRKVTGYVVEYKPLNATEWERIPVVKEPTATVDGLKKGEKYVFRVAAKNDVGTGEPSRPTKPVECKPKYTTADGPGQPSVDDVGKNFVDLSWPKPLKDGGSRITGYVVEKRKKNAPDWEPATPGGKPVSGNQAHIEDLDENGEYEFRVRPVNAAGVGAPSDPTPLVKVKPKYGKWTKHTILSASPPRS
uniref:Fibronectin type-III domain-containing protein n=1 Tax=Echinostoma caproni TaxID=27848 RepID=A0A183BBQ3_9TREM